MNNLEKLEKEISEKLPRLKEHTRTSGCMAFLPHIMLNDVLEWLGIIGEFENQYAIESDGELKLWDTWDHEWNLKAKWDLSKPLLKDQSQELIDYLKGLI